MNYFEEVNTWIQPVNENGPNSEFKVGDWVRQTVKFSAKDISVPASKENEIRTLLSYFGLGIKKGSFKNSPNNNADFIIVGDPIDIKRFKKVFGY